MSFYDDFYNEPSEFEQQIDEFKQSLILSVKTEYQEEMERLKKENAELQEFKNEKELIKREYDNNLQKIKGEQSHFEQDLKNMRLTELFGENFLTGWFSKYEYVNKPKCDKCDENRYIHYKTPSGKDAKEICQDCGESIKIYSPVEIKCYKFNQSKNKRNDKYPVALYFEYKEQKDCESFEQCRRVYNGEGFDQIPCYSHMVFWDKEACQKYCDWRNFNAK